MRICAISDTHNYPIDELPEADILLVAGDVTNQGTIPEISRFNEYCKNNLHKYTYGIYVTPGNHDWLAQKHPAMCEELLDSCNLLIDESVSIQGLNFYFSPWTPWFFDWAFNFNENDIQQATEHWARIPDDTHVLITHGPPRSILDRTPDRYDHMGRNVGCGPLLYRTLDLEELRLHVFGHIHHSANSYEKHGNKVYANVSLCNERYQPINKAFLADVTPTSITVV